MTPIVLTPHQTEAVQFLTDHLHDGDPIVALRGLAGTGKTSLIPTLIDVLEGTGIPVTLGAPTHRAAMVLRKKGLEQADTVHSHALVAHFTGDYTKALRWLGGSCQCKVDELANAHAPVDGVPWLVVERLPLTGCTQHTVKARAAQHDPKRALESIGIYGRSHFAGFGPKEGTGVLVIDEASMVGADMLALCQEAFPQLCLIGDPGQLPPVKDAAALASVPGFDLTEIHRQAQDSAIVQLAYAAREGQKFWERIPYRAGEVEEYLAVDAAAFLTSPLIVWRNKVRIECTQAIRSALGYPPHSPTVGEPLVCRTSDPRARADGFYNNALFRVTGVSDNPRQVLVKADGPDDAEEHEVLVHMEETDGPNIDPEAILFRYGYCLTAHTAQGGEWPTVYISKPDLMAQARRKQEGDEDEHALRQWAYTAITRAKTTLGFLRKHDFGGTTPLTPAAWTLPPLQGETMPRMQHEPKVAPPSAPFLNNTPADAPDDIPDPLVPASLAEDAMAAAVPGLRAELEQALEGAGLRPTTAVVPSNGQTPPVVPSTVPALPESIVTLAHGFAQYVQGLLGKQLEEAAIRMTKSVDLTMSEMAQYTKGVLTCNEHAEMQLSSALLKLGEDGLKLVETPYTLQVQVRNPAGVPIVITVRKATAAELLDELTRLEAWLAMQGYSAENGVAA
jgi:exodeoxyribonuclease V